MSVRRLGICILRADDNSQRLLRGVVRYVREYGQWEVYTREGVPWLNWEQLRYFRGDGIVAMVFEASQYRLLRRRRVPCVNACARSETPALASVYSDNPQIGRVAAATLWNTGVRHFAFVGRPNFYHDRARGDGFQQALKARGASCEVFEVEPLTDHPRDMVDIRRIVKGLRQLPLPVGIFAAHDHLGCQVLAACGKLGLRVPHEVAVIGVNDFTLLCETAQPPLSSIRQQAERTGYEAARLLTEIVEGRADPTTHILLPPGEVMHRRSTDTVAVHDSEVRQALLFIRREFPNAISMEDVADHVAMSRRGLDKRFVAALGHTPAEELRQVRLRRAEELLSQTNLGISEVGARCGFRSLSSFDRAFQEATGMTPGRYRKKYRAVT